MKRPRTQSFHPLRCGFKAEAKEPFPLGSLKKYVAQERDKEMLALLKGTVQEPAT